MDEWLVYFGISNYGTVAQRIIACFVATDTSHDGVLQAAEVDQLFRLCIKSAVGAGGEDVAEGNIRGAVVYVMRMGRNVCGTEQRNSLAWVP